MSLGKWSFKMWRWIKRLFKKPKPSITPEPQVSSDFTPKEYQVHYQQLWDTMVIDTTRINAINWYVKKIREGEARYKEVEKISGVPWQLIGCKHLLEGAGDFSRVLHNGEAIIGTGRKTKLVPKNRGPFDSWEEAAVDALAIKKQPKEWNIVNTLYYCERFNGLGYLRDPKKPNSPYIWSGSNHYTRGKYYADGKYSPTLVSKQIGVAVILKRLGYESLASV